MAPTPPLLCPRCGTVNAASAHFCARCAQQLGAAANAAVPTAATYGAAPRAYAAMPGYAPATPQQLASALPRKTRRGFPWVLLGGATALVMIGLAVVSQVIKPVPVNCAHNCPHPPPPPPPPPPASPALSSLTRYTSSSYGYSLEYTSDLAPAKTDGASIGWAGTVRGNGAPVSWTFTGDAANGRSAQDIVDALQQANFQSASYIYTIPGAELGYMDGFGKVYSLSIQPASGQSMDGRLVIMVAVRNNVAVELVGVGPFQKTTYSDGHPNPAQTPIVNWFDLSANSVTWQGETPL